MEIIGWDIGGAHLKLARVRDGRVLALRQAPCALWQGVDRLAAAMAEGLAGWPAPERHAVTMTGEVADVFPDRASGVRAILAAVARRLDGAAISVYASDGRFLAAADAAGSPERVASANWHATAQLTAARIGDGLLVDIGSTTTDIVPLRGGAIVARGWDDAARLACDELVYCGVVRTPVMAVVRHVELDGVRSGVMAEHFATMADVYRLTGELPAHADQHATADGRGKSLRESGARLARMVGRDASAAPEETWRVLARYIAGRQLQQLQQAAERVLSAAALPAEAPLIGAGVGRFVAQALARLLARPYRGFDQIIPALDGAMAALAADAAPAVAVALLCEPSRLSG
jgi:(4-(4-[2-(gamma-L-glutamylamino)ethyl]phenoxymethyl)furan-2-yl)methanamine synthase